MSPHAAYLDLDGTLLAPDGRVVPDTLAAVETLVAGGWTPVLLTGRSRWVASTVGRLLGIREVVCELGAVVLLGGVEHPTAGTDGAVPVAPPVDAVLRALRAGGVGPVQAHEPGAPRASGHVLRVAAGGDGAAPVARADAALAAGGLRGWHAVDNGASHRAVDGSVARVLHVLPAGVDKRAGVLAHRALTGVRRPDCVALGDSPADLEVAPVVGRVLLVAGDRVAERAARTAGVPVTRAVAAAGALEAALALGAEG